MKRSPTEKPGLSFRTKLTFSFIAVSGTLLFASLFFLSRFAYEVVLKKVAADYEHTMLSTQRLLDLRAQDVNDGLELSLSDPLFRSELARARDAGLDLGLGVKSGSLEASHSVFSSTSLPLFTKYEIFAILTAEGILIYSRQEKGRYGDDWSTVATIKEARYGKIGMSIVDSFEKKDGPFLVLSLPVWSGDNIIGVFLIGEPLSSDLIPRIEATSGAVVYIDTGSQKLFGLKRSLERSKYPELVESSGKVEIRQFDGVAHLAARMPIKNPLTSETVAHALLLKPLDAEMGAVRKGLELALVKILVLAIIASALAAALVSRRVTAALTLLRNGVRRVQDGDLAVELAATSGDEFGQLTRAFNDMTAGLRQRALLKSSFEKYVASPVVEGIINNAAAPEVRSERRVITVLFSDIEGFTNMVETQEPSLLVRDLNEYLAFLTNEIKRRSGTVDKFVGDAVMAIWGFGESRVADAGLACEAALAVQERSTARPTWLTRIGINTGEAIVGNIGSQDRLQYTAIGDMVNVAARLEALNKRFRTRILVNSPTRDAASGADLLFRDLGAILLRGKKQPVRVYEVFAKASEVKEENKEFCQTFNEAVGDFMVREWSRAERGFKSCLRLRPEDKAGSLYLAQAIDYQKSDPGAEIPTALPAE